jgi:hypothetical protein
MKYLSQLLPALWGRGGFKFRVNVFVRIQIFYQISSTQLNPKISTTLFSDPGSERVILKI